MAGEALLQVDKLELNLPDFTTYSSLFTTGIWATVQNGKVPYCPPLIDHCATPVQALWVGMIGCLFPIDLSRGSHSHFLWLSRKRKKTVFAQWCHLKYAGTVDVYWKVKHSINKGWRYFRCAAYQNIALSSICHLISRFFFPSPLALNSYTRLRN